MSEVPRLVKSSYSVFTFAQAVRKPTWELPGHTDIIGKAEISNHRREGKAEVECLDIGHACLAHLLTCSQTDPSGTRAAQLCNGHPEVAEVLT